MARLVKTLMVLMVLPSLVWGATQILSVNFDDQTLGSDSRLVTRKYGATAAYGEYVWGEGRGGTGYSYQSGTVNEAYLEWGGTFSPGSAPIGNWETGELYTSFWVRFVSYTVDSDNWWNIKMFYPRWGGGTAEHALSTPDYSPPTWALQPYLFTQLIGSSTVNGLSFYVPGIANGNWHRLEFYVNFNTGDYRAWYDRPTGNWEDGSYRVLNTNLGSTFWTSYITHICYGGIDANTANTFTRALDDIEIWDGMPDETPAPAPPTLSNVTISNGSFR